ncbi:DUF6049 family protein [Actinomyces sp. MRS3W]|uniref:DUF6049 family protein n=1 Tax=Actinomyces sp. MRS3W TaxID=2800796 RepID=UPI0028FD1FB2|nr:DUF6049 family protein [Actinomyces sp. MRS3W]MDU0348149.1 DUF6049 family protein [Actinomyces sp. MRS3W]
MSRIPALHPTRPGAVVRVLTAMLSALLLLVAPTAQAVVPGAGPSVSVQPATVDAVTEGRVTLSVTKLTPEVIGSGEDVTLTGTITNGTEETLKDPMLVVQMQSRTALTTTELTSWLAAEHDTPLATVKLESLTEAVAPGTEVSFTVTLSSENLPLTDTDQWGPRGVQVALTQGYTTITQDRTILLWNPGVRVSPARVTAFVPVTASPQELLALTAAEPAEVPVSSASADDDASTADADADSGQTLSSLRERVLGLLDLADDGVVLAVDPALLAALGLSSAAAQATATGTAEASPDPTDAATATADSTDSTAESTDADATALREGLAAALAAGDVVVLPWADADLAALAHLGENDLIDSALTRAASSQAAQEGAATDLVWSTGALDTTTLAALPDSVTTVLAAPGDAPVAEDLTYTPSGTMILDGRTLLIPDAGLSAAISGNLVTTEGDADLSDLNAVQLLRSETAILTRQAPAMSRDVIVAVSREDAARTDPATLRERLTALTSSTWTQAQDLKALTQTAAESAAEGSEAMRMPLPESTTGEGELTAMTLAAARAASTRLELVASILSDPDGALGVATDVIALATSASWRTDGPACTTMIAQARNRGETVTEGLAAAPSSTINLIAAAADLPVRIVSSLGQDVTVRVHLESSSPRLQTSKDVTVTVPAGGQTTASVPVTAVGSGDVDLTIELLAADGTSVGTPSTVHLRVRADWENVGTRILSGVLVVLLVAGIIRTVRRGRRTATPRERT